MVKRTDFERMLAKLTELIKVAIQPGEAMHVLIDFSAGLLGSGFLSAIRNLPFGLDVDDLEKWLLHVVTTEPVPADITAYWFGLFNPYYEGAATSCLYVAGSSRFEAGADNEDWACSPKYFPTGRYANSSILRAIYRAGVDHEEPEGNTFACGMLRLRSPRYAAGFHRFC